jgi:hypothetical protein
MAITVKHSKVSTIPDDADTSLVRPSDWNADHALTGVIDVANGGTGASTLTGYVKGSGTSAMTAAATVPSTDITGLGTISTQNANAVAITGGTINGTTIGATTAVAGSFTDLSVTGTTSFDGSQGTAGQVLTSAGTGNTPTWSTPSGGVTGFTSGENTTAPNATVYVDFLQASAAVTNADVAFVAKGNGATLAQVPDNLTTGGNKRGIFATDWQKTRAVNTQVASSPYSFVGGGASNAAQTAATGYNVVVGGANNRATGDYSFVGGGGDAVTATNRNTASGANSAVVSGRVNTASGQHSFVGGGSDNTASGTASVIVGGGFDFGGAPNANSGYAAFVGAGISHNNSGKNAGIVSGDSNNTSGLNSFIGSGRNNLSDATSSAVLGGSYGTTRSIIGNHVFPACLFPVSQSSGISQSALLILGAQTTDATATALRSNTSAASGTNQVILPNNSAYFFRGEVISGKTAGGDTKGWTIEGVIKRGANAAATTLVGVTVISTHGDAGAATWTVAVTADTTNGGIRVTFTGQLATTIRTVCQIRTTEMTF